MNVLFTPVVLVKLALQNIPVDALMRLSSQEYAPKQDMYHEKLHPPLTLTRLDQSLRLLPSLNPHRR